MRQHLGQQLFSVLCEQSHGGLTPFMALIHLVKAQATDLVSSEYQGGNTLTSTSGLSYSSEYSALQKVKLDQAKAMKTVDILLGARKTFLRNRRLIKCESESVNYRSTQGPGILSRSENKDNRHRHRHRYDGIISISSLWGSRLKNLSVQLESIEQRLFNIPIIADISKVDFSWQDVNKVVREHTRTYISQIKGRDRR